MTTLAHHDTHAPHNNGVVIFIAVIAALGGLLFGYDTGVIGVALLGLGKQFAMDDLTKQLVTGGIIFGALFGCLITGPLSDRLGRRIMIVVVAIVFLVGSLASAIAHTTEFLIFSRFILGLSVGSSTQIIPVYIAEVAPPEHRGKMVVLFQFMIVFGITIAYFSGFVLGDHWRWMFGLGVFPAIILLIGMIFLPESPRWLVMKHRDQEAIAILNRLRSNEKMVQAEMDDIHTVANQPQGSWKDLAQPWIRPAVIVGAGIAMFSQITGNNALIYYGPTILTAAGFSEKLAVLGMGSSSILVVVDIYYGRCQHQLWH